MRARSGYSIKTLGERCYLSADSFEGMQSPRLFLLNKTGRLIWDILQTSQTEDDVVTSVATHFGMDRMSVYDDVHEFLLAARNENLIEENE